jgi:glyoxylase-like metal-dependent hydrolase (beta-lactamase superfamily II)
VSDEITHPAKAQFDLPTAADADYAFDDNVWIEPWPGHTPGHVCVVARSPQVSVVLSGDIMHTPLQCAEPQLNAVPAQMRKWRAGHAGDSSRPSPIVQ